MTTKAKTEPTEEAGANGPTQATAPTEEWHGGPTGATRMYHAYDERTIHHRLVAVLAALPAIGKDQQNVQQKFMYRGHDDVMNALNPLLALHGIFVVPDVRERLVSTRTTSRDTTMYEVNLHVRYRFYGAAGDYIEASAWGEGTDMGDKSTNKAMTMAFKNVLAQVFAISTAELSDADAGSPEETRTSGGAAPQPRAPRQQGRQRTQVEFDPGAMLAPGAINVRSEEDADSIRQALRDFDADQPWHEIENLLVLTLFEKPYEELEKAQKREYYTRLANLVVRVGDLAGPGDFPPPSPDQIEEAIAWAFKGAQIALERDLAAQEATEGAGAADDSPEAQEAAERDTDAPAAEE